MPPLKVLFIASEDKENLSVPDPASALIRVGCTVEIVTVPSTFTTPMIFDPIHEPCGCGGDASQFAPGIVAEKLNECEKQCGR